MNNKIILASIICSTFIVGTITGVSAQTNLKEITANINDALKLKIHGQDFVSKDSEGNVLQPIIYNGNSYLPVRSLSEALNVSVSYDETTSTINLGENQTKSSLINLRPAAGGDSTFVSSKDPDILSIFNEKITEGFYTLKPSNIIPRTANFRLYEKYQKASFRVAVIGAPAQIVLSDQRTKIELRKIEVKETDGFKSINLSNLNGVDYLDIHIFGTKDGTTEKVVITDATVE